MMGLTNVTLSQQFEHVRTTFGALSDDYLEVFFRELSQVQTRKIALYMKLHADAEVSLFPLDKLAMLKTCFAYGDYQRAITRYFRDHPQTPRVPPQQGDQSFEDLLAVLTRESQMMQTTVLPPQRCM
jgi:hypothetical protein